MASNMHSIHIKPSRRHLTLHVQEWSATGEHAPTVLLIHGMGGDGYNWEYVAPFLQASGYRVIAPDLAGHGLSPRRAQYSPLTWAQDILHTLDGQPAPELVIGHSLGGLIAAAVALQLPNKPRMVLIDPLMTLPRGVILEVAKRALLHMRTFTAASLHRSKPSWSGRQINLELKAISLWDPNAVNGLNPEQAERITRRFRSLGLPTTIIRPVLSVLVPAPVVPGMQRRGMNVISIPKAGHNLHRDDNEGFLNRLTEILAENLEPADVSA